MKLAMKLLALFFVMLLLANVANAESPREQLNQMVEQLQKSPDDNVLREKIIKLAQGLKPVPAVPEEAERHTAFDTGAFTDAKSLADSKDDRVGIEAVNRSGYSDGFRLASTLTSEVAKPVADNTTQKEVYFLLAGGFENADIANKLKLKLSLLGIEASVQDSTRPDKSEWHQVRLGPYKSADEMNKALAVLKQNGMDATPAVLKQNGKYATPIDRSSHLFTPTEASRVTTKMLVNVANAESPRDQLNQMVDQLQKTPNDNALRERIIKIAHGLKPAPAVPEEAILNEGRAQAAFKNAKSGNDYLDSAHEYIKAVAIAPWVLGYYSDLCTIYEKAGIYVEAIRYCRFSVVGEGQAVVSEMQRRIAGLEYMSEKNSDSALGERLDIPKETTIPEFPAGTRYFCLAGYGDHIRMDQWVVLYGSSLSTVNVNWPSAERMAKDEREHLRGDHVSITQLDQVNNKRFVNHSRILPEVYDINDDGSVITLWYDVPEGHFLKNSKYQCRRM